MIGTSFQRYLETLHKRFKSLRTGEVADYIPELANVDENSFGITIVTVDGHVYQVGDTHHGFTIQSISKAFTYGIALEDSGVDQVMAKIDVEPSGEAFNSISLEPDTGRPRNPMINAGAIVATSLVRNDLPGGRLERILAAFGKHAGRNLDIDEDVYRSERDTGHRNRAISHMLRNYDILEQEPEPVLDSYFRQCSIRVNCRDLALMGACIANDGVNPITGVRALHTTQVPRVLSVMATCGMYDYSGNWIYSVGMPAKSGVGGGIVAVLPGQFGLAVYSPRLDDKGNSVRGIAVCEAVSADFGLHMLRATRTTSASVIRSSYTLKQVRSKLYRPPEHAQLLNKAGARALVLELAGELMFVSAELIVTRVSAQLEALSHVILDLHRVTSIDQSATQLLAELCDALAGQGVTPLLTGFRGLHGVERKLKHELGDELTRSALAHEVLDQAIEWCEDRLLQAAGVSAHQAGSDALSEQPLCRGFSTGELALLADLLTETQLPAGTRICQEGEAADQLYFLSSGQVSTWIKKNGREGHRLFASSAGWSFGESALFGDRKRTADVVADTDVTLFHLRPEALEQSQHPDAIQVRLKLFTNLARVNIDRLKQANSEIRMLSN